MRGYAAIGLFRPKDKFNLGGVLRAAHCYGAAAIVVEGDRTPVTSREDVSKAYRHIPVFRGEDLFGLIPFACIPVAVDLIPGAAPLPTFTHPERAFYIFGPEDGTLGRRHTERCKYVVSVPTAYCMNLAATVNVVLYDRMAKRGRVSLSIAAE